MIHEIYGLYESHELYESENFIKFSDALHTRYSRPDTPDQKGDSMLSQDTNLSMAVAAIGTRAELERVLEHVKAYAPERVSALEDKIRAIHRDLRQVPIPYAIGTYGT